MSVQTERSGFRNLVIVAAGVLAAATLALSLTVWWLRSDAIDDASKNAANLAIVLAEQTTHSVESIDLILNEVQEHLKRIGVTTPEAFRRLLQGEDTFKLLTERLSHLSNATLIALIDNNGRLVSSTNKWPLPPTDLSDHENFLHFLKNDDKGIYIAKPVTDRFKGEQIVLFSKRFNNANNGFIGMVSVGVKLSYFQRIYGSIDSLPNQTIALLRNDGTVILRHPDIKDRSGAKIPAGSPWYRLVSQGGGTYRSPGYFDGIARQVGVQPLSAYPLVIDVTVSETAALANWRNHASFIALGTLLALFCSAFLLRVMSMKVRLLIDSEATSAEKSRELQRANMTVDAALNNISQGLVMFDSSARLIVCNQRYLELYGVSSEFVRPGCSFREILEQGVAAGNLSVDDVDRYIAEVLAGVSRGVEFSRTVTLRDGRIICGVNHPMADGGWVATLEDISEKKRAEDRIIHVAHHDALTGLPNRILFAEQLERALKRVRRGELLAVLYIDLDHFKQINDTLGHPIADELLKGVAERLLGCIRDIDTVARLSGDEFAIIQSPIDQPSDAAALAVRIREAMRVPIELSGHQVIVDTSIGISIAPDDGEELHELLKTADIALYEAKNTGRGTYCFYETDMNERMQIRGKLEQDLRAALANGEFELFYQPIVNLRDNKISAFEALLRWHHPERGMVSPSEFIPVAEEMGLIDQLGEWVLRTACAEAMTWPNDIKVAVNVSPVQFKNQALPLTVIGVLAESGLPARRLELEITETAIIHDEEGTSVKLSQLRELGVKIALDDFGTGYSSLSYLHRIPFDKIKIDKSFIDNIASNDHSLAIVQAVIVVAKTRNVTVVAEGVETEQQRELLRTLECAEMQGYLFSRPVPVQGLLKFFPTRAQTAADTASAA